MTTWIALLQGINIGKNKRISMTDLKKLVADIGGDDVATHINSGNVVFRHDSTDASDLESQIEEAVEAHIGVTVPVILRTAAELAAVVDMNPFPAATSEPKTLHVTFLRKKIANVLDGIDPGKDSLQASGREFYMHLPKGVSGQTYDTKTLNKRLGPDATSRNWNTVTKLLAMCDR